MYRSNGPLVKNVSTCWNPSQAALRCSRCSRQDFGLETSWGGDESGQYVHVLQHTEDADNHKNEQGGAGLAHDSVINHRATESFLRGERYVTHMGI